MSLNISFPARCLSAFAAAAAAALPASAQDMPARGGAALDEVIVTAQRREQNVLDVPVAISTVSGEAMQNKAIEDVQRLAEEIPSLVVGGQGQTFGGVNISLRGVGSSVGDPAVGYYVDEIYMPNSSGYVSQFIDTERVEVLKGPQGTLWGRNTTGGAVHYITKKPTGTFGLEAYAETGYYDSLSASDLPIRKLGAAVNLPIGDTVQFRLSAARIEQDNYTFNLERGAPEPNADATSLRGTLRIAPTQSLEILVSADYTDDPHHNSFLFRNEPYPGSGASFVLDLITDIGPEEEIFQVRSDLDPEADYTEKGARINVNWDLNQQWRLRSITGGRELELNRAADLDVTQATMVHNFTQQAHTWASQEVQLQFDGERNDLTFGGFYYTDDQEQDAQTVASVPFAFMAQCNSPNTPALGAQAAICPLINNTILPLMPLFNGMQPFVRADFEAGGAWDQVVNLLAGGTSALDILKAEEIVPITTSVRDFNTNSTAFYGQWSWQFADPLTLTAGLRWTKDEKIAQASTIVSGVPRFAAVDTDFSAITPKLGLEWRPSGDTLAYATVSRGFKSGALDVFAATGQDPVVDEETSWAYEVGLKGQWFDRRLTLEAALFYYDYEDYQLNVQLAEGPVLVSLDALEVKGVEFGPVYRPVPQAKLGFSVTYLETEVTEFNDLAVNPFDRPAGPQSLIGKPLPNTPELKGTAFGEYTWQLGSLELTGGVTAQYSDDYYADIFQAFEIGGYTLVNANLRLAPDDVKWWVNLYARNIGNEEYVLTTFFADQIGQVQFYGPPRTIGLQAGLRF